jgi:hypothetical protein
VSQNGRKEFFLSFHEWDGESIVSEEAYSVLSATALPRYRGQPFLKRGVMPESTRRYRNPDRAEGRAKGRITIHGKEIICRRIRIANPVRNFSSEREGTIVRRSSSAMRTKEETHAALVKD